MKYELMHKDICVLTMEIRDKQGWINRICEVMEPKHLPVGVPFEDNSVDEVELNDWWTKRSIPLSRRGIRDLIEALYIGTPTELLTKCFGLSLSDQYWVKPIKENLTWKDVNFFDHAFSEDIGDILFRHSRKNKKELKLNSPDNTTDGNLKKRWKIINDDLLLIKAGSGALQQEVFNEKIASKIMDRLNIPHVNYDILWIDGIPYSACKDFINPNEDLVSASRFMKIEKQSNSETSYTHLCRLAQKYKIENFQQDLDKMLVLDFIIANEDRHFNNFGFIRDVNTLKFKGMAPIFDSGSSLGFQTTTTRLSDYNPKWEPFMYDKVKSQLDLVSSFEWLDIKALHQIELDIRTVFLESQGFIDQIRTDAIVDMIKNRIQILEKYISKHNRMK